MAQLSKQESERLWAEGLALSVEQIITHLLVGEAKCHSIIVSSTED